MTQPLAARRQALLTATSFHRKPNEWPTGRGAPAALVEASDLPEYDMLGGYGRRYPSPLAGFQAPGMPQLFILNGDADRWLIDTQGYSYARYVALIG